MLFIFKFLLTSWIVGGETDSLFNSSASEMHMRELYFENLLFHKIYNILHKDTYVQRRMLSSLIVIMSQTHDVLFKWESSLFEWGADEIESTFPVWEQYFLLNHLPHTAFIRWQHASTYSPKNAQHVVSNVLVLALTLWNNVLGSCLAPTISSYLRDKVHHHTRFISWFF